MECGFIRKGRRQAFEYVAECFAGGLDVSRPDQVQARARRQRRRIRRVRREFYRCDATPGGESGEGASAPVRMGASAMIRASRPKSV